MHSLTFRPVDDEELRRVPCLAAAMFGDPADSDAPADVPPVNGDDELWLATAESTEVVSGAPRESHEAEKG